MASNEAEWKKAFIQRLLEMELGLRILWMKMEKRQTDLPHATEQYHMTTGRVEDDDVHEHLEGMRSIIKALGGDTELMLKMRRAGGM